MNEECEEYEEEYEPDPDRTYDTMRDDMLTEDYDTLVKWYGIDKVRRYRGERNADNRNRSNI